MTDILEFGLQRWRKEPEMGAEDAYKWLYHATLGGEHAVVDDAGPRRWMDSEWATLGEPFPGEPDTVPLRPDGLLVRVNLRPFKASGGDSERLLQVFVASASRFHADRAVFVCEWLRLGELLAEGQVGRMSLSDWQRVDAEARPEGYPAIEHSEEYLLTRKPAYRVVLAELWAK